MKEQKKIETLTYDKLPDILTVKDISSYLKLGKVNTYNLVKQKGFPSINIGNTIKVPKKEFLKWLDNFIQKAGDEND